MTAFAHAILWRPGMALPPRPRAGPWRRRPFVRPLAAWMADLVSKGGHLVYTAGGHLSYGCPPSGAGYDTACSFCDSAVTPINWLCTFGSDATLVSGCVNQTAGYGIEVTGGSVAGQTFCVPFLINNYIGGTYCLWQLDVPGVTVTYYSGGCGGSPFTGFLRLRLLVSSLHGVLFRVVFVWSGDNVTGLDTPWLDANESAGGGAGGDNNQFCTATRTLTLNANGNLPANATATVTVTPNGC